ncbi:MAG: YheU family protein [Deltaproteobacteria bacterium]|nr:YheU family protein [Deltaproteobacteria bacterium]
MEIPYESLAAETLRAVLEEFCTREGTEYGEVEMTLDDKVQLLFGQLRSGKAGLVYEAHLGELRMVDDRELEMLRGG